MPGKFMNLRKGENLATVMQVFLNAARAEGIPVALYKSVRYPFLRFFRKTKSVENQSMIAEILKAADIESRFTKIYSTNYWGSTESASGHGSTFNSTRNLRRHLPIMLNQFSIRRVLDAPCGDFNWMRLVTKECDVEYIGADIVPALIEHNNARYRGPKTKFVRLDITKDEFPRADLWICRDCLFHLSFEDTLRALKNYVNSGTPYFLSTTFKNPGKFENTDIITGDFRLIDLFSKPYCLPREVHFRIDDYLGRHQKEMCLWSREQIMDALHEFH